MQLLLRHSPLFLTFIPPSSSSQLHFTRTTSRVSSFLNLPKSMIWCSYRSRLCCSTSNTNNVKSVQAYSSSDAEDSCPRTESDGSGSSGEKLLSSNETLKKLKRYGISGILSYGLLNTAYYLTMFLLVWFYISPAPGQMGYLAAVERFVKVMAMVWAGSQVTKLARAAGALALAPFVDRGLSWFTAKYKFESQGKAFVAIVGFCFGLAAVMFLVVTLVSA